MKCRERGKVVKNSGYPIIYDVGEGSGERKK